MWVAQVKTVLARKGHRCCNCGEAIIPGEEYIRWVSFDGSVFTNKMHHECYDSLNSEGGFWEYDFYGGERPR